MVWIMHYNVPVTFKKKSFCSNQFRLINVEAKASVTGRMKDK